MVSRLEQAMRAGGAQDGKTKVGGGHDLTKELGTKEAWRLEALWYANRHHRQPFVPSSSDKEIAPLVEGSGVSFGPDSWKQKIRRVTNLRSLSATHNYGQFKVICETVCWGPI